MIYFTADCHFGQERTLHLSKRPFADVCEMDKTMINNWNNTVSKNDDVYILGDFGVYNYTKYLNGRLHLIKGNYERNEDHEYLKQYFDTVFLLDNITKMVSHNKRHYTVTMTHEPLNLTDPISPYEINLFGHVHKLCLVKKYGVNVGMDCHNFTPISMDTILHYHNSIFNYYDGNVFN